MDIAIDPKALQTIVSDAIFKSLDEKKRDTLIQAALQHLMTPAKAAGGWGSREGSTPLEQAFQVACAQAAQKIVTEELQKPEQREKIAAIIHKAFDKAFLSEDGKIVDELAKSLVNAVTFRRD